MGDARERLAVAVEVEGACVDDKVDQRRRRRGRDDEPGIVAASQLDGAFVDEELGAVVVRLAERQRAGAILHETGRTLDDGVDREIAQGMDIKQGGSASNGSSGQADIPGLGDKRAAGKREGVKPAGRKESRGEASAVRDHAAAAVERQAVDGVRPVERRRSGQESVGSCRRVRDGSAKRRDDGGSGGRKVVGSTRGEVAEGGVRGRQQAEAIDVARHETGAGRIDADDVRTDIADDTGRGGDDVDAARARGSAEEARSGVEVKSTAVRGARGGE